MPWTVVQLSPAANEWTQIEHNMCGLWVVWSKLWWWSCEQLIDHHCSSHQYMRYCVSVPFTLAVAIISIFPLAFDILRIFGRPQIAKHFLLVARWPMWHDFHSFLWLERFQELSLPSCYRRGGDKCLRHSAGSLRPLVWVAWDYL